MLQKENPMFCVFYHTFLFGLIFPCHQSLWKEAKSGTQGKMLGATEAEAMEGCCFLAYFQYLVQPALFYNLGLLAQGWHHAQWAGLSHIHHEENRFSHRPIWWRQFISRGALFPSDSNLLLAFKSESFCHKKTGSRVLCFNDWPVVGNLEKKEKMNSKQTSSQLRMTGKKS